MRALRAAGLSVRVRPVEDETAPAGQVIAQSTTDGTLPRGETVTIEVAVTPPPRPTPEPVVPTPEPVPAPPPTPGRDARRPRPS